MIPLDWHLNDRYPNPETYLGSIPTVLDALDPDPIYRQFDRRSPGGWWPELPDKGWQLTADDALLFPGLPPLMPAAHAWHLGEKVLVYPAGWVCVVQLGGSYTIARILL